MKAPVAHEVDPDLQLSWKELSEIRLPPRFNLIGGDCCDCGYRLYGIYYIECRTESGVWTTARIKPSPDACRAIEDGWSLAGSHKRLAELHDAKGNRDRAMSHYARLIDLWKNADADLQLHAPSSAVPGMHMLAEQVSAPVHTSMSSQSAATR